MQKKRKLKDWRHLMAAATLATACVSVLASLHIVFLHQKSESNERQIAVWSSKLERIRRMESSLEAFAQAETSRGRFMGLLSELSASTPGSVVLKELRIEQDGVALKGEIESQSMLNETLQSFQEIKGLRDVKLEHSRLRKRLNREFFEFEINAQWSD